jgi:hypothetical protein
MPLGALVVGLKGTVLGSPPTLPELVEPVYEGLKGGGLELVWNLGSLSSSSSNESTLYGLSYCGL